MMKHCNIGMDIKHVVSIINSFADTISRGPQDEILIPLFKNKYPSNSATCECLQVQSLEAEIFFRRLYLLEDMISVISSAQLQKNTSISSHPNRKTWGRFAPE